MRMHKRLHSNEAGNELFRSVLHDFRGGAERRVRTEPAEFAAKREFLSDGHSSLKKNS